MHESSSSRPSFRDLHFDLLMAQHPKFSCHFLAFLTFDHLHSSMLLAYDNSVWSALEVHNGDKHGSFSDLFVTWKRFPFGFSPNHRLVTGFVLHPLVSRILLFLNICLIHNRGNYNCLFGLHKLHFFEDIYS